MSEGDPAGKKKTSGYFRDEFGHWARFYDAGLRAGLLPLGGEARFRRMIIDEAILKPGHTVLDVNCGTGTLALMMSAQVGADGRVVGIDLADHMLDVGRKKDSKHMVEFVRANAEDLPFSDSSFDRVTSSLAIHEMNSEGRANAMAEIWRVLRPGGRLLAADLRRPDTLLTRIGMRVVMLGETDTLPDMWEKDLAREIALPGFDVVSRKPAARGFFEIISAVKPR